MIVECFGLPGSGKTYFANEKSDEYFNFMKFRYSLIGKIWFKIYSWILKWTRSYKYIESKIIDIINKNKLIILSSRTKEYIHMYCFISIIYDKYSKKEKKVIFDEGKIQILVSLFYENNWDINIAIHEIFSCNNTSKYVYINTGVRKSFENIKVRNRKICEIDYLDDDSIRNLLIKQKEMFDLFQKYLIERGMLW